MEKSIAIARGFARRCPAVLRSSLCLASRLGHAAAPNIEQEVSLMTLSDFGRSLGNNGSGSDHGWAGNQLVVGGSLKGGNRLGELPDYNLGGDSDVGAKGRMIPSLASLFPNLANFKTASDDALSSAYLADIFA